MAVSVSIFRSAHGKSGEQTRFPSEKANSVTLMPRETFVSRASSSSILTTQPPTGVRPAREQRHLLVGADSPP